ncbi:MAG: hypothetical protein U5N56_04255 [Candidatus Marinimicrobia bacterium]|nr:hypothetical protein [Candidatus Neomarinimicrobiota bacterium]
MKRKTLIFTGALLAVGIALAASEKYRQDKPYVPGPGTGVNARTSVLTEDEQKKFYEAKLEYEKKVIPLRADLRVMRMEIDKMIREGGSEKDIQSYLNKLNDLRTSLNNERISHQIAIREIVGETKYMQMGRHRRLSGRGEGPDSRMERKSRDNRRYNRDCYYGERSANSRRR